MGEEKKGRRNPKDWGTQIGEVAEGHRKGTEKEKGHRKESKGVDIDLTSFQCKASRQCNGKGNPREKGSIR